MSGYTTYYRPIEPKLAPEYSGMLTMARLEIPAGHPSQDPKFWEQFQQQQQLPTPSSSSTARSSSVSSTESASSASSNSPPAESKDSPASSVNDHWAQMSFLLSPSSEECLACGYRYGTTEELAHHQRMDHGLAEVIF